MIPEGGWHLVERPDAHLWAFETAPEGPVVVLLHGLAGHALEWTRTIDELSLQFRVVAVEQRGHGTSTRRPDDMSRRAFVDDVVAVIDSLDVDDVILVGQSMGAHTAMLVAADSPDLVSRLVMVESGLGGGGPESANAVATWLAGWPVPFEDHEEFVAFFGGNPVVARAWAEGLEHRDDGWWPQWDAERLGTALLDVHSREFETEWEAVEAPTLLVRGENGMIPGDQFTRMLASRPGTELVTIPAAGHDVHLEQPEAWHAALSDFLDAR